MGTAINATLLTFLLVMAIGSSQYSAVAQQCSSTYDCRLTQCPCIDGHCQPNCHSTRNSGHKTSFPAKQDERIHVP
ncbi:hypothetical protein RND81_02G223900 [Saponaria officinalis]|uniref:Uncharacterized protein n=1 Tax=Saponaria officinalis TaxID=3572 RepID=A0AAW1MPI0_SAPOF